MFQGVVEAQFPRVIRKPLHLWGLFVFNFSFSVNEKPLSKQQCGPRQLPTAARPRSPEWRVDADPEPRGLLTGVPSQGGFVLCKLKCRP